MNKPIIETMINTAALALTSYGVMEITKGNYMGLIALSTGMILEFAKYFGRHKKLWK